jgi:hypothetical protein
MGCMRRVIVLVVLGLVAAAAVATGLFEWSGSSATIAHINFTRQRGWKAVSVDGLRFDVPASWGIERTWVPSCGLADPTVFLNPTRFAATSCPAGPAYASSVIAGSPTLVRRAHGHGGSAPPHHKMAVVNGLRLSYTSKVVRVVGTVAEHRGRGPVTDITVWVTTLNVALSISVGNHVVQPGGAPGRATLVFDSIRPAH